MVEEEHIEADGEVDIGFTEDEMDVEVIHTQRQILPRESKARHKVLTEKAQAAKVNGPSSKSRKGTRKPRH